MNEAQPTQPQGLDGPSLVADPVKAEEMAYAGKFYREQAVGLANAIETTITDGGSVVTDPYYLDSTGKRQQTYSIPKAVEVADAHNAEADIKEAEVADEYDARKAQANAAVAQLEAIKAGKRIVRDQERTE